MVNCYGMLSFHGFLCSVWGGCMPWLLYRYSNPPTAPPQVIYLDTSQKCFPCRLTSSLGDLGKETWWIHISLRCFYIYIYSMVTCKLQQKELENLVKKTYIDMVNRCGFEPYISHISFIMYSIYFPKRSTSNTIDPLCFWSPNAPKNVDILQFSPRDVHLEIPATQQRWRTNRLHHVVLLGRCPNWTPVFCCKTDGLEQWMWMIQMIFTDSSDFFLQMNSKFLLPANRKLAGLWVLLQVCAEVRYFSTCTCSSRGAARVSCSNQVTQ